jgi:glycosyltransferase involved in cell wall biosynthesis
MLKILIIGYVWPEPNSSGAGIRMMELIQLFLEQNWSITYASPAATSEHMEDLDVLGVSKQSIEVNESSFDTFISELNPDIVLFDRFMMEEQFGWRVERVCPAALRIIESIDLHLLRDARHRLAKESCQVVKDVGKHDLYNEIAKREIASIYRSDLTLLISAYEMKLLIQQFSLPGDLLHLTPFMFDENHIVTSSPCFDDRHRFISIGNFRHAPNWDSVRWLSETIWPMIREQLPDAELHIYGAYPPKKATALHRPEMGFHIKGWAANALDVMKQARVSLAPLRFGAGIKGKLADSMLAGTPNVTTSVGSESMCGGLDWSGAIADDPQAFANAAVSLYQDRKSWQSAQKNGYAIVRTFFNKAENGASLINRIEKCRKNIETDRLNNFTGTMLRHHHLRSTEFMSRWIEEKNREKS